MAMVSINDGDENNPLSGHYWRDHVLGNVNKALPALAPAQKSELEILTQSPDLAPDQKAKFDLLSEPYRYQLGLMIHRKPKIADTLTASKTEDIEHAIRVGYNTGLKIVDQRIAPVVTKDPVTGKVDKESAARMRQTLSQRPALIDVNSFGQYGIHTSLYEVALGAYHNAQLIGHQELYKHEDSAGMGVDIEGDETGGDADHLKTHRPRIHHTSARRR